MVGRIGKQVQNLCGTAAVRMEFGFRMSLWVHTGRRCRALTTEPEDLPCSVAEKAGARDGRTKRLRVKSRAQFRVLCFQAFLVLRKAFFHELARTKERKK